MNKKNFTSHKHDPILKEVFKEVIELLRDGKTKNEVLEEIRKLEKYKRISKKDLLETITSAVIYTIKEHDKRVGTIIGLHTARYDKQIKSLLATDFDLVNPRFVRAYKMSVYDDILETMEEKEKLLGLHSKNTIESFTGKSISLINDLITEEGYVEKFNFDGLTYDENVELMNLINDCIAKDELNGIIDYEDVVVEKENKEEKDYDGLNIDKITILNDDEGEIGVDIITPDIRTVEDVKNKLREALKQQALKKFQEVSYKKIKE